MSRPDSVNDQPSYVDSFGTKFWYKNGNLHRDEDLPACESPNVGYKAWYRDGNLHRDGDKPACEWADGSKEWYKDGIEYFPNQTIQNQASTQTAKEKLMETFEKRRSEMQNRISELDFVINAIKEELD